jgi:hypothetical protein
VVVKKKSLKRFGGLKMIFYLCTPVENEGVKK